MEAIIVGVLGPLLGYLAKRYLDERQWRQVRDIARQIGKDPEKTNDPRVAVAQALLEVQLDRLAAEARKVSDAFTPNGTNPIPRLNIQLIENDRDSK